MKTQTTTSRLRGFSLVELMVAMVIGLVIALAIFSLLHGFESRKRNVQSVNDIDQAGSWAVYTLDKWVRSAGTGFSQSDGSTYGCTLSAALNGSQILPRTEALPAPFAGINSGTANVFKLIPLLILPDQTTPAVSGQDSDVLLVMAGSSGQGETAIMFDDDPSASQLNLLSAMNFSAGDLVLVTDLSAAPTGSPCLLEQVSGTFTFSTATATALPLATSGDYYAATVNSTALTSFTDTTNDAAINLGNTANGNPPLFLVIGVGDNNTLQGFDLLQNMNPVSNGSQTPFPIADSVFEMHARYGIDSDGDNKVDDWVEAGGDYAPAQLTAGTATALSLIKTIKAVRIGLIMRTQIPEKDAVSGNSLSLFSDLGTSFTRPLSGDEQHYRYRTLEMTIPLRNPLMLSSSS